MDGSLTDDDFAAEVILRQRIPAQLTRSGCNFLNDYVAKHRIYLHQAQAMARLQGMIDVLVESASGRESQLQEAMQTRMDVIAIEFNRISRYRDDYDLRDLVDNFLTYMSELAVEILRGHPERLRTNVSVPVSSVIAYPTMESFIEFAVEETVLSEARKGWRSVRRLLKSTCNLEIHPDPDQDLRLERAVLLRNLLTHQRGQVDARFLKAWMQAGGEGARLSVGTRFPEALVKGAIPATNFLEWVFRVDADAAANFSLEVLDPRNSLPSYRFVAGSTPDGTRIT